MIFLDVGAHEGQTLEEVVDPRYGFQHIYAFEPMPRQFGELERRFGGHPRVKLLNFGLANFSGRGPLYGSNDAMEASIYAEKRDVDAAVQTVCSFTAARYVVADLTSLRCDIVVKLNCEGAEVEILDDLIDGHALRPIFNVLIDFDIRKVPGREAEAERVLTRLADVGFDRYSLAEDVMVGVTHQERIRNWLDGVLPSAP